MSIASGFMLVPAPSTSFVMAGLYDPPSGPELAATKPCGADACLSSAAMASLRSVS